MIQEIWWDGFIWGFSVVGVLLCFAFLFFSIKIGWLD